MGFFALQLALDTSILTVLSKVRKILAPIKIKSALPPHPPPQNPPLKRRILWTWVFLQKERIFPGVHKIGAAISGPQTCGHQFYGHEDFSDKEISQGKHRLDRQGAV